MLPCMSDAQPVRLTAGLPQTVIPPEPGAVLDALAAAMNEPTAAARKSAVAVVAGRRPRFLAAWATLAELADDPVESYAYARVGYHRGLDTLRAAGWRGSGYCRWTHESNRGFLRSLEALRAAAERIGEADEAARCAEFLLQLDPEWTRRSA